MVAISCAIIGFVIVIGKIVVCFLSPVVETRQWHVSTVVGVLYVVKSLVCCWLSDWGHRRQNHPTLSPLPCNAFAFIIQCCLRLLAMLSGRRAVSLACLGIFSFICRDVPALPLYVAGYCGVSFLIIIVSFARKHTI